MASQYPGSNESGKIESTLEVLLRTPHQVANLRRSQPLTLTLCSWTIEKILNSQWLCTNVVPRKIVGLIENQLGPKLILRILVSQQNAHNFWPSMWISTAQDDLCER